MSDRETAERVRIGAAAMWIEDATALAVPRAAAFSLCYGHGVVESRTGRCGAVDANEYQKLLPISYIAKFCRIPVDGTAAVTS
jgi:hypothetical protein